MTRLDEEALLLKVSRKEQCSVISVRCHGPLGERLHSVWDAPSLWRSIYETSNTCSVWKVCSWSRKCCWWGRTWSPCCFNDRCNDRSGQFPHAAWSVCDVNV